MTSHTKAYLQIHVSVFLFGFTAILGALIQLSSPVLVWYRLGIAGLVYLLLLAVRGQLVLLPRKDLLRLTLLGITLGLHWVSFYASIKLAGASVALICLSSATFFTAVLQPLFSGGKIARREVVVGLLVVLGIYLVFTAKGHPLGILIGVISALLASLGGILNKRMVGRYSASAINFYEFTTCWLIFTLLAPLYLLWQPQTVTLPSFSDAIYLVVLAVVCTNIAHNLALIALRRLTSFQYILAINLEPIYGILLAYFLLGEDRQLSWPFVTGTLLVFAAVFYDVVLKLGHRLGSRPPG